MSILQQGCETLSSMQSDNTAWEGHSIDELVASWGAADKTKQLGDDYIAYTWTEDGTSCEHTFSVSKERITGYSSSDCDD